MASNVGIFSRQATGLVLVFIDAGWRVAGLHLGPLSEANLAASLDALEAGRPLPAP